MKKTLYIIIFSAAAWLASSCNDEAFLSESPKYFYSAENAFTTPSQVDQALIACYSKLRDMYSFREESKTTFSYRGNNGTDMFDVPSIRHSFQFNDYSNINPENEVFKNVFSDWYKMISYANFTIMGADKKEIVWESDASRKYIIAQARFFRAWSYLNLGELFGGVPIVTEFCDTPRYDFKRATRLETYQYAIDELEAILEDLPEESPERGRLCKGAAQHALMQLYIDKGVVLDEEGLSDEARNAYSKAVDYGDLLIGGGRYSLMTERFGKRKDEGPKFYYACTPEAQTEEHSYESAGVILEGNVFWDLFQEGNQDYKDGNRESIWILRMDHDAFIKEDKVSRLTYSRVYGPNFDPVKGDLKGGSLEDLGGRGVAFIMPTEYTRDLIFQNKWNVDMRNSETVLRRKLVGNVPTSQYYGKVVPWDYIYKENDASQDVRDAAYTQSFPISCKIHLDTYQEANDGRKEKMFRDEYVIRLAESILLRAEAYFRLGNKTWAAKDINLLRERAKCSHQVLASEVTLDLILDERARELMYEEHRWNTLLRMGGTVAVDRIQEYSYWNYPRTGTMKTFNLWPIPQSVIDTNKDETIRQNDGWK